MIRTGYLRWEIDVADERSPVDSLEEKEQLKNDVVNGRIEKHTGGKEKKIVVNRRKGPKMSSLKR